MQLACFVERQTNLRVDDVGAESRLLDGNRRVSLVVKADVNTAIGLVFTLEKDVRRARRRDAEVSHDTTFGVWCGDVGASRGWP